ncbi:V-type ATPase, D subunit [Edhazardia aedis USNM 41457]|uniref:V-type ATPase, D subunit n=1 Tax=Edhazardia aedis (strain USNM 41457) TaxID=1003232 RepID=J9DND7_EDHAE|nr:V-type ATPase, D subunit [Edhazardia aedis USNM 41457]|eukprot:EJW02902.1 V-type ATPase, D subunit [Edhazardia aedis USNM 41457]
MTNDQRLHVFPTRMNLTTTKVRLKSAEKGYTLLKRKSDALQKRHRDTQALLAQKRKEIENITRDAFFSLTEAEFHGANFNMYIHECKKIPTTVLVETEQVSGVILPKFTLNIPNNPVKFLDKSGTCLVKCRSKFLSVLKLLIELVSLQNSFIILEEVLKSVNRRVNALEFLLIPRLENTVNYINAELDEQDREEFFRLKKIQNLKKKDEEDEK